MSNPRPRFAFLALILALAAFGSIVATLPAAAQYRDVFGDMVPGPGDQQMVRERAQLLLDGPADPRTLNWENAASGNSGTVVLQREFVRDTQQCRQLEYRIIHRSRDQPFVTSLIWCKQANGQWAIVG